MGILLYKLFLLQQHQNLVRRKNMKIGIFGTGAYGMALASILSENKHDITMWTKFQEE